jgi:hypothetical protein
MLGLLVLVRELRGNRDNNCILEEDGIETRQRVRLPRFWRSPEDVCFIR